jgi:CheY-like chemotaxis protein
VSDIELRMHQGTFIFKSNIPRGHSNGEAWFMTDNRRPRVLLVDDEPSICETMALLLNEGGYDVETAIHGLDALIKLRFTVPDAIISDLNMPQMSGFEFLSVVHTRFPSIPVMAMSGLSDFGDQVPDGVFADAFYAKGRCRPSEILHSVGNMIHSSTGRPTSDAKPDAVQKAWYRDEPGGATSVMLTCPECLRSVDLTTGGCEVVQEVDCPSCAITIRFEEGSLLATMFERAFTATQPISLSIPDA